MNDILKKLNKIGVIPVVRIEDTNTAVPLAEAVLAGGLSCIEVTFRTDQAEESIQRIIEAIPDMLVGAGTVLTMEQVDCAIRAGAGFIVSPGLNPDIVSYCIEKGILIIPGCATPSEMEKAMSFGLDVVKFFPAEQNGGLSYINAVSAPYGALRFIPTGGITAGNLKEYLACSCILACGGSWMVKPELIKEGRYDRIAELCREAAELCKDARNGIVS
jgi:2-dehydro-3-deoxyphosphogluconate aldolase / (4S)-4-hydroxy-2-oxoglutarate aldolase